VNDHQIALVTEHGEEPGGGLLIHFQISEQGRGFSQDMFLLASAERFPGRPAHAKHLMQQVGAVEAQRCRRQVVDFSARGLRFHAAFRFLWFRDL